MDFVGATVVTGNSRIAVSCQNESIGMGYLEQRPGNELTEKQNNRDGTL